MRSRFVAVFMTVLQVSTRRFALKNYARQDVLVSSIKLEYFLDCPLY
jgi:hypothetical protein